MPPSTPAPFDPVGTPGWDIDGQGISGANDEYIAIVNVSGLTIDLTDVEIWEDGLLHAFGGLLRVHARAARAFAQRHWGYG